MVFATDLDRTMIYSNKFLEKMAPQDIILVETLDGKEISYMNKDAVQKLQILMKKIQVIPVTTRSIQQFERVNFFEQCEYAITTNGGTILHNGKILLEWEQNIKKVLEFCQPSFEEIIQTLEQCSFIVERPVIIDGKFVFTRTNNVQLCKTFLEQIIDKNIWNYTIQNQKVYVIPKKITKKFALEYLCKELLNDYEIIAAGDSQLDLEMLEYAKIAIIPKHATLDLMSFNRNKKIFVVGNGINAANEIISIVREATNKKVI